MTGEKKVIKEEFLASVAERAGLSERTVYKVYDALLRELLTVLAQGSVLRLTGFGKFHLQLHRGGPVQFANGGKGGRLPDYYVLKFSATRPINRLVGHMAQGGELPRVLPRTDTEPSERRLETSPLRPLEVLEH